MGLLKQLGEMFDQAWEDLMYDRASLLPTLFEVDNIDKKWLPLLKPLLGFTKDLSFEATESELRKILSRAVPFWNAKPSELGCVDHAIRMVTGNRFRVRNYFDHRMVVEETCLTEEAEDFDPMVIGFPSNVARNLTILIGGGDPRAFDVTSGLATTFVTDHDFDFLVIEYPAAWRGVYAIDHLLGGVSSKAGFVVHAAFPNPGESVTGSLYGSMDEYVTEIRLVDQAHGELDYDQVVVDFVAGERIMGGTSGARATVLSVTPGTPSTMTLSRIHGRFVDNEVLTGTVAGKAVTKGRLRGVLNRDLLWFLLGTNRPASERYDAVYLAFLDEFQTPGDLDQWATTGGVTSPDGAGALMPLGSTMICNDPYATVVDVDADGVSDDGWQDATIRWKFTPTITFGTHQFRGLFHYKDATNYFVVHYNLITKTVYLGHVAGGLLTVLATSAVQPYLKDGVTDLIRVDTYLDGSDVVARVVLDGEEIIPWTKDVASPSIGGKVGAVSIAGETLLKLVEVNTWPTDRADMISTDILTEA